MFWKARKLFPSSSADAGRDPLWKNFLKSMALLLVALASALLSSSAVNAPDVITTFLAALFSLIIAVWVGVRFVPRLARSVDWTWMPVFTRYRVTSEGGIFLGAVVIVLLAAINTSNNLLYMVLSALLAILLLSGLLSTRNFRHLEMELLLPARAFAGDPIPVSLRIRNHRRILPAISLQTEPPGRSLYFPVIQPQGSVQYLGETRFARRGRYTFRKLRTASRFPFGFFVKARDFPVEAECICYPAVRPVDQLDMSIVDILGAHQRLERGTGTDLYTIRDYVPSDSARHVHWKATAKTAALKTREFAAEESRHIVLAFDRRGYPADAELFEELVSRAASLAFDLTKSGVTVTVVSDEWESPAGNAEAALDAILNYLALVEMSSDARPPRQDPDRQPVLLSLRGGGA